MNVLVTGSSGIAGKWTCRLLKEAGHSVRMADMTPPAPEHRAEGEFVRCDTRIATDVLRACENMDVVVHLAAWHCAHNPPVSDEAIFAVNVDGTFNVIQACRQHKVRGLVFASSMAYGWGGIYSVTKVLGEDLCRMFHESTRVPVIMLRYHDFVPKNYLAFGAKLFRNGVDAMDVARSNLAATEAVLNNRVGRYMTIVHSHHGMPSEVVNDFRRLGPDWCESQMPGAKMLLAKYAIELPERVEQHDLSSAQCEIGWTPQVNAVDFLKDLMRRDRQGQDVSALWAAGSLSHVITM